MAKAKPDRKDKFVDSGEGIVVYTKDGKPWKGDKDDKDKKGKGKKASSVLTASDRVALIHLAASMPVGNPERRAILAGLQKLDSLDDE